MPSWVETPGHGYLKVTLGQLYKSIERKGFQPTRHSMVNLAGTHAFLEEDVDAQYFLNATSVPLNVSREYRVQYLKNGLDDEKYMTIPQTREALWRWIEIVAQRDELPAGTVVELDSYPSKRWTIIEARRRRGKTEYSLENRKTGEWGWANSNRITDIL